MGHESILKRFDRLNVWSRGGQRAPHKPLLVLYALGRLSRGWSASPTLRTWTGTGAKSSRGTFARHRQVDTKTDRRGGLAMPQAIPQGLTREHILAGRPTWRKATPLV